VARDREELERRVLETYEETESVSETAMLLGIPSSEVAKILRKYGVPVEAAARSAKSRQKGERSEEPEPEAKEAPRAEATKEERAKAAVSDLAAGLIKIGTFKFELPVVMWYSHLKRKGYRGTFEDFLNACALEAMKLRGYDVRIEYDPDVIKEVMEEVNP